MSKGAAFLPLSPREESIGREVVDAAYKVHRTLGPGLLERVYESCFCYELEKRGLKVQRQLAVPVVYDGVKFEEALRLDVLVEELVICELKAQEVLLPVWDAQLLSYLRLTNLRLGYRINFGAARMDDGLKRFVL